MIFFRINYKIKYQIPTHGHAIKRYNLYNISWIMWAITKQCTVCYIKRISWMFTFIYAATTVIGC